LSNDTDKASRGPVTNLQPVISLRDNYGTYIHDSLD
jgi:hypothetical protein